MAEERIQEILWIIQPTLASEQKRKEVIDYIRMLVKAYYSTEVRIYIHFSFIYHFKKKKKLNAISVNFDTILRGWILGVSVISPFLCLL